MIRFDLSRYFVPGARLWCYSHKVHLSEMRDAILLRSMLRASFHVIRGPPHERISCALEGCACYWVKTPLLQFLSPAHAPRWSLTHLNSNRQRRIAAVISVIARTRQVSCWHFYLWRLCWRRLCAWVKWWCGWVTHNRIISFVFL